MPTTRQISGNYSDIRNCSLVLGLWPRLQTVYGAQEHQAGERTAGPGTGRDQGAGRSNGEPRQGAEEDWSRQEEDGAWPQEGGRVTGLNWPSLLVTTTLSGPGTASHTSTTVPSGCSNPADPADLQYCGTSQQSKRRHRRKTAGR